MQESDVEAFSARTRSLVDENYTFALSVGEASCHVFSLECDVMDTSATVVFLDELGDGAFGACGFKQLELNFTNLRLSSTSDRERFHSKG